MGKQAKEGKKVNATATNATPAQKAKAAPAPQQDKKVEKKPPASTESPEGKLSMLRPKRRLIFFITFFLTCVWLLAMYEPCESKKKQDCGWPGVSALQCRAYACFVQGGGERLTKTITLKRAEGEKFGLKIDTSKESMKARSNSYFVRSVEEGAVRAHNDALPAGSDERIQAGDFISKIDGSSGNAMKSKLEALTEPKTHTIEVKRADLPFYLQWTTAHDKLAFVESVATSPLAIQWSKMMSNIGGVGLACWFASGYPLTSLPMYFTMTAAVSYRLTGCCFNDQVKPGVPQCYKPVPATIQDVLPKAFNNSVALVQKMKKKPKKYFGFLTSWQKDLEFLWK